MVSNLNRFRLYLHSTAVHIEHRSIGNTRHFLIYRLFFRVQVIDKEHNYWAPGQQRQRLQMQLQLQQTLEDNIRLTADRELTEWEEVGLVDLLCFFMVRASSIAFGICTYTALVALSGFIRCCALSTWQRSSAGDLLQALIIAAGIQFLPCCRFICVNIPHSSPLEFKSPAAIHSAEV